MWTSQHAFVRFVNHIQPCSPLNNIFLISSAACFSPFFDALRADGVAIRAEVSVMEFKRRLVSGLIKELSKVWNGQCIAQNLAILKDPTQRYDNSSCSRWYVLHFSINIFL